MGWMQNWQRKAEKFLSSTVTELFQIISKTLLSLLLPLSFLLLARSSCYSYLSTINSDPTQAHPYSFSSSFSPFFSFFLHTALAILYAIVSLISISTLANGLTGKLTLLSGSTGPIYRPGLYTAWMLLCSLQICVRLGVDESIAAGINIESSFGVETSLLSRVIFFLGLYETMFHWSTSVVRTVVDDTFFGGTRDERWVQKAITGLSFGTLWWWRLRDEVETLVIVAEAKRELWIGVGAADMVGWGLYYLTVTIGMVRVIKGAMWVGMILFFGRVRRNYGDSGGVEDKV